MALEEVVLSHEVKAELRVEDLLLAGVPSTLERDLRVYLTVDAVLKRGGEEAAGLVYLDNPLLVHGDRLAEPFSAFVEQMLHSLDRLALLDDATQIHCGHEYTADSLRFAAHAEPNNPDIAARVREVESQRSKGEPTASASMDLEKRTNPFLRVRVPDLREAIEAYVGERIENDIDAFAQLRHWKDDFDGLTRL